MNEWQKKVFLPDQLGSREANFMYICRDIMTMENDTKNNNNNK